MAAIIEPLLVAGIVFFLGIGATLLLPNAEWEAGEINAKLVFGFLLGPVCFAALILVVDGVADHLYLVTRLQP
jgi:hypothetical protein